MREYGQIQSTFWGDADIQGLSDFAKLLGAYLLTGPHSNGIGCFRLPLGYVVEDLGKDSETVSKGFDELSRIDFVHRCATTDYIVIRNFLIWNPIGNPNVAKSRQKEFDLVPRKFKHYSALCYELARHGKHFEERFQEVFESLSKQDPTPTPTPTHSLPNPERNTTLVDHKTMDARNAYPDWFEEIWARVPRREGSDPKKAAFQGCNARIREGTEIEDLRAGLERYARFLEVKGISGTDKQMQLKRFFGSEREYEQDWTIAKGTLAEEAQCGPPPSAKVV